MSMDEMLNKTITIKQGLETGIISSRILSDFDMWQRVEIVMSQENVIKTHAVEIVAKKCKVCEDTVWKSHSFTSKIIRVI